MRRGRLAQTLAPSRLVELVARVAASGWAQHSRNDNAGCNCCESQLDLRPLFYQSSVPPWTPTRAIWGELLRPGGWGPFRGWNAAGGHAGVPLPLNRTETTHVLTILVNNALQKVDNMAVNPDN